MIFLRKISTVACLVLSCALVCVSALPPSTDVRENAVASWNKRADVNSPLFSVSRDTLTNIYFTTGCAYGACSYFGTDNAAGVIATIGFGFGAIQTLGNWAGFIGYYKRSGGVLHPDMLATMEGLCKGGRYVQYNAEAMALSAVTNGTVSVVTRSGFEHVATWRGRHGLYVRTVSATKRDDISSEMWLEERVDMDYRTSESTDSMAEEIGNQLIREYPNSQAACMQLSDRTVTGGYTYAYLRVAGDTSDVGGLNGCDDNNAYLE